MIEVFSIALTNLTGFIPLIALLASTLTIMHEYDSYTLFVKFDKHYRPQRYGVLLNFIIQTPILILVISIFSTPFFVIGVSMGNEHSISLLIMFLIIFTCFLTAYIANEIGFEITTHGYKNLSTDPVAQTWVLLPENEKKQIKDKRKQVYLAALSRSIFSKERVHPKA